MSFTELQTAAGVEDAARILPILEALVGFDTTSRNSNLPLIDYAEALLSALGARCLRIPDADRRKANLLASFGPVDRPGTVLSGHTDVVPVDGQQWSSDPFRLAVRDGLAYGRGTADMKGFIAVCLGLAPELARAALASPVHIALSYDEELGCLGAPDLARAILDTRGPQQAVIVGEPTSMETVIGHKANCGIEIIITGRAAHSSLAPTTVNAIDVATAFLDEFATMARHAAAADKDELYDIATSTICVTGIEGGTAINIVPAQCRIVAEFRLLPALDARSYIARLEALAARLLPALRQRVPEADIVVRETFSYPGLDTPADDPLVARVMHAAGGNRVAKVAYGTEAGVFSTLLGAPTVIIGPGSIEEAHKPDEFIAVSELTACAAFIRRFLSGRR